MNNSLLIMSVIISVMLNPTKIFTVSLSEYILQLHLGGGAVEHNV